eukprot:m.216453 g.216453  ORF g.216453 m.216453 type:complete len:341 (+) comp25650_c0_seq3:1129-2151(+)
MGLSDISWRVGCSVRRGGGDDDGDRGHPEVLVRNHVAVEQCHPHESIRSEPHRHRGVLGDRERVAPLSHSDIEGRGVGVSAVAATNRNHLERVDVEVERVVRRLGLVAVDADLPLLQLPQRHVPDDVVCTRRPRLPINIKRREWRPKAHRAARREEDDVKRVGRRRGGPQVGHVRGPGRQRRRRGHCDRIPRDWEGRQYSREDYGVVFKLRVVRRVGSRDQVVCPGGRAPNRQIEPGPRSQQRSRVDVRCVHPDPILCHDIYLAPAIVGAFGMLAALVADSIGRQISRSRTTTRVGEVRNDCELEERAEASGDQPKERELARPHRRQHRSVGTVGEHHAV